MALADKVRDAIDGAYAEMTAMLYRAAFNNREGGQPDEVVVEEFAKGLANLESLHGKLAGAAASAAARVERSP